MGSLSTALQVVVLVCTYVCFFVAAEQQQQQEQLQAAQNIHVVVGTEHVELKGNQQQADEKFCAPPPADSSPSSPSYTSPSPSSPSYTSPSPSSPSYTSPSPYYSPSPSSGSSPSSSSPYVYAPVSAPAAPDCPPLAAWFTSPSAAGSSSSSWWDDQIAAEDKQQQQQKAAENTAAQDGQQKLSIPGFFSPPPPSPPLIPASGPYSGAPETSSEPGTCEYWSSHTSAIPAFLEGALVNLIELLGITFPNVPVPFSSGTTLLQGLTTTRTDAYGALMRQGSAALINSYHFANFAYNPQQVREGFNGALYSEQAAAVQAVKFENANRGLYVRSAP